MDQVIRESKSSQKTIAGTLIEIWLSMLCEALKYIHAKKIIHRDVKPANIFLGKFKNIKLGDFGLAKKLESTMDSAKTECGTPSYKAPEIWKKQPYNEKVDMWALGCTIFELCMLEPRFTYNSIAEIPNFVKEITTSVFHPPIPQQQYGNVARFIPGLLEIQPDRRLSADQILNEEHQEQQQPVAMDVQWVQFEEVKFPGFMTEIELDPSGFQTKLELVRQFEKDLEVVKSETKITEDESCAEPDLEGGRQRQIIGTRSSFARRARAKIINFFGARAQSEPQMMGLEQSDPDMAPLHQHQQPEPLTAAMLAAASPQGKKQMVGERLFPLVQNVMKRSEENICPAEITDMLLEKEDNDMLLLRMLEDKNFLRSKVGTCFFCFDLFHVNITRTSLSGG